MFKRTKVPPPQKHTSRYPGALSLGKGEVLALTEIWGEHRVKSRTGPSRGDVPQGVCRLLVGLSQGRPEVGARAAEEADSAG